MITTFTTEVSGEPGPAQPARPASRLALLGPLLIALVVLGLRAQVKR
jgi:hypothetical protein